MCIIFLSEARLEEKEEYKNYEDNPWMFWQAISTCERRYYKIDYKYMRYKSIKHSVNPPFGWGGGGELNLLPIKQKQPSKGIPYPFSAWR